MYFTLKGTILIPSKSLDVYRTGGEPFGLEVIYKKGAPRGRMAMSVTESVLLAVDGDVVHEAINHFSEPAIRWRVLIANNLLAVARALREAVQRTLLDGGCDVSLGVEYLDQALGENALFQIDPTGAKHNNLLQHFKRLTRWGLLTLSLNAVDPELAMQLTLPLDPELESS